MTRPSKAAIRLYKPKNDTTTIKARVTTIEKSQFEDFCKEHKIKLSDLLRLGARFIIKHPEVLK
jgi:hypothetical protein